jgi:hypothetical protein
MVRVIRSGDPATADLRPQRPNTFRIESAHIRQIAAG